MVTKIQNYRNHRRFHVPFHFVLAPLLLFHLIYQIVRLVQEPSFDRAEMVLLAIALIVMQGIVRLNSLRLQDRIIRLEEQLRYTRLLSPELAGQAANLPLNQILALRFASDTELPILVERTLQGEFEKPDQIKQSVQNWRGDYLRV